jgi:hypothetical protein
VKQAKSGVFQRRRFLYGAPGMAHTPGGRKISRFASAIARFFLEKKACNFLKYIYHKPNKFSCIICYEEVSSVKGFYFMNYFTFVVVRDVSGWVFPRRRLCSACPCTKAGFRNAASPDLILSGPRCR